MKNKNLTINKLALGNLKQRKKQYAVMIVGIILAMVLSSGIMFFLFSSYESYDVLHTDTYGGQTAVVSSPAGKDLFDKGIEDGMIIDYGLAHIIGLGYTEENGEELGTAIAWLDDKTKLISGQSFIEGGYPENENEIAIEKTALLKLGIDAKIGDEITLQVKTQDNGDYLDTVTKTYTLVGIATDKRQNFAGGNDYGVMPAAFVAQGTQTEAGGKELLSGYIVCEDSEDSIGTAMSLTFYFGSVAHEGNQMVMSAYNTRQFWRYVDGAGDMGIFIIIIGVILVLASCIAIVNSFNSNLRERKKQIGMFRAVGTTKRQIIKIFGREALIISLICTPISMALSYGLVRLLMYLINEKAIITKSLITLPISAVICIAVAMLAAVIPIISATRITPMQAIRDINITQKMRAKKIKSQKEFDVAPHLAKRNMALYKGSKAAVTVILIASVLFSCIGFSAIHDMTADMKNVDFDYKIDKPTITFDEYTWDSEYVNYDWEGISESDMRFIEEFPYFSKIVSEKAVSAVFEVDEILDYHLCFSPLRNVFNDSEIKPIPGADYESYWEETTDLNSDWYLGYKEQFGRGKDILKANVFSYDDRTIKTLEDRLTAGSIDYDKLSSGEEIILIAPQTAKFALNIDEYDQANERTFCDNERIDKDYRVLAQSENPYSVGDRIKLSVIGYEGVDEDYNEIYSRVDKEVTIGAIISPLDVSDDISVYNSFCFLTTHEGLGNFSPNTGYYNILLNVDQNIELDNTADEMISGALLPYADKYGALFTSNFENNQNKMSVINSFMITMLCIIALGFSVCAGIVNNSLTASIREKRREIGTLRAVGADAAVLVSSYIRQLISMFAIGLAVGFGGYAVIFAAVKILQRFTDGDLAFDLSFSPWETLAFCLILFVICSFNLWSKIRKEMKNSIVENIREL